MNAVGNNISVSKVYKNASLIQGSEYYDYQNYQLKFGSCDDYEVLDMVGRGKYSEVFLGVDTKTGKKCAIKTLKPVRKDKVAREVLILRDLERLDNKYIIKLLDVVRCKETSVISLIFEYVNTTDFRETYAMEPLDCKLYFYKLLCALHTCHKNGIFHRDIKPQNIVIDDSKSEKVLKLVDWGLAEFYIPNTAYNVRVASRYYKGPELLINMKEYDYSLDIWSFGCILAAAVLRVDTFFKGSSNEDQLVKIAEVLGTDDLYAYAQKYKCEIPERLQRALGSKKKVDLKDLVKDTMPMATKDAIDLISNCLVYDHSKRITAKEARKHPFFSDIAKEDMKAANESKSKLKKTKNRGS